MFLKQERPKRDDLKKKLTDILTKTSYNIVCIYFSFRTFLKKKKMRKKLAFSSGGGGVDPTPSFLYPPCPTPIPLRLAFASAKFFLSAPCF